MSGTGTGYDACTGFYVGSGVSANGNTLFGETSDLDIHTPMYYASYGAGDV